MPRVEDLVNVEQAAQMLGVTPGRIRQLAREDDIEKRLVGQHIGRDWFFERSVVEEYAARPKVDGRGRPRGPRKVK